MASCCYPDEYGRFFDAKEAARVAKHYLKNGLTGTARELADGIEATGIGGRTVLEVGGGVGQILADLLRRGASSGTSIDLSPQWDAPAHDLLAELQLDDRVRRHTGDFVDSAQDLGHPGAVVLHRVVCCYPHWDRMLDATVALSPEVIGLTFPRERIGTKAVLGLGNWLFRLRGRRFRVFVHPEEAMLGRLTGQGYRVGFDRPHPIWRTVVLERTTVLD